MDNTITEQEITLYYLEDAVRALAQPFSIQEPLSGEELTVDFEAWYAKAVRNGYLANLTHIQPRNKYTSYLY